MLKRLAFAALLLLAGCETATSVRPILINEIRGANPDIKSEMAVIHRNQYQNALDLHKGSAGGRIVQLFRTSEAGTLPEYRIFEIKKGSAMEMLGLRDSDILIAAHGYVIQEPKQFYSYLQLLPRENESFIEIRRAEHPIMIKVSLIPTLPQIVQQK